MAQQMNGGITEGNWGRVDKVNNEAGHYPVVYQLRLTRANMV